MADAVSSRALNICGLFPSLACSVHLDSGCSRGFISRTFHQPVESIVRSVRKYSNLFGYSHQYLNIHYIFEHSATNLPSAGAEEDGRKGGRCCWGTGQTDAQTFGIRWRHARCSQRASRGLPAAGGGRHPLRVLCRVFADPSFVHDVLL